MIKIIIHCDGCKATLRTADENYTMHEDITEDIKGVSHAAGWQCVPLRDTDAYRDLCPKCVEKRSNKDD